MIEKQEIQPIDPEELSKIWSIFAHPERWSMICLLYENPMGLTSSEIAIILNMEKGRSSSHLANLRNSGIAKPVTGQWKGARHTLNSEKFECIKNASLLLLEMSDSLRERESNVKSIY